MTVASRWLLLGTGILAIGCRPREAPHASQTIAISESTLSVFQQVGANCEWWIVDAGSAVDADHPVDARLGELPHVCSGVYVSFNRSGTEAIVRFEMGNSLWRATPRDGSLSPLPDLPPGHVDQADFDEGGQLWVEHWAIPAKNPQRKSTQLLLNGARWSTKERDLAVSPLDPGLRSRWQLTAKTAGPPSRRIDDPEQLLALATLAALPKRDPDVWYALPAQGGEIATPILRARTAAPAAFLARSPTLLPSLGRKDLEPIAVIIRGKWALVVEPSNGNRPRLYDVEKKRLVYQSDTATQVTFWQPDTAVLEPQWAP